MKEEKGQNRRLDKGRKQWVSLAAGVLVCILNTSEGRPQQILPDGFAGAAGAGLNGTSGGSGGMIVTVSTTSEFLSALRRQMRCIIRVQGLITLSDMEDVRSDKTIVGVDTLGVISGGGLNLSGVANVILQNLLFRDSIDDAVNIEDGTHHVWIDHCDFMRAFDGLLDIKKGSDYVTVSWNRFSEHQKTCLVGHDDANAAQDTGHLRVTYHHNWFKGTTERHPRVRFSALSHVYNNYYFNNTYGIASTMDAEVLVESNFFSGVSHPTRVGYGDSGPGDLAVRDNIFSNCANPPDMRGEVQEPPYAYVPDSASQVPGKVMAGAGRAGFTECATGPWMVYDASVLPEEHVPAFTAVGNSGPADTLCVIMGDPDHEGNAWFRCASPDAGASMMWSFPWSIAPESGATAAFRVKPSDPAVFHETLELFFRDGTLNEKCVLSPGGAVHLESADVSYTLGTDPNGWHTFRITFKGGESNVYVDEGWAPVLTGMTSVPDTASDIAFGDGKSDRTCGFDLDWLLFNASGAFSPAESPIPEGLVVDRSGSGISGGTCSVTDRIILKQNYPNPFNPQTAIEFMLPRSCHGTAGIYSVQGRLISILFEGTFTAGIHRFILNAGEWTPGIYFCVLRAGGTVETRKMVLLK